MAKEGHADQEDEQEPEEEEEEEEADHEEAEEEKDELEEEEEGIRALHPSRPPDSEEEADRDQDMLQKECLPVSGPPLPPKAEPPKDADEYLRQVQWERMHAPQVVEAPDVVEEQQPRRRKRRGLVGNNGSLLAQFDTADVPEELSFCTEWAEDVAEAFRLLRQRCSEARDHASASGEVGSLSFDAWRVRCEQGRPSTGFLATQDFLSINHLIVVAVEAIVTLQESMAVAEGSADKEAGGATARHFSAQLDESCMERLGLLAEWAFAALAFVDCPLADDIQYQLQRLRRSCKRLIVSQQCRTRASRGKHEGGPPHAKANLLLAIVTEVFGQR